MMVTGSRMRQVGWLASLGLCVGIFIVLSFHVHAVKSEVLLAERKIVALKRQTVLLEIEFQTRSSQRQLASWNAVEFGMEAPRADQYLDSERQLASLGQPVSPGAPDPIRVARSDGPAGDGQRFSMVSPVSGEPVTLAANKRAADTGSAFTNAFNDFIGEASPISAAKAQTPRREGGE
jgi:hypothetical protein